ncbi:MAG: hypothetical protein AAF590_07035 [Pseudomonadota bacterium]
MTAAESLKTDETALAQEAREILIANDRGGYTVPTAGLYPYQWNWDSAIVALGFAAFDLNRAWTEIETLVAHQWPDGMVPHIIFHEEVPSYFPGPSVWSTGRPVPTSGHSQPPVAAFCVEELLKRDQGPAMLERASAMFDALMRWHRWWHDYRDPDRLGVVAITHPWESGRDNTSDWDEALEAVDGSNVAPFQRRDTSHVDASMRPTEDEYKRYIALVEFGRSLGWDAGKIAEHNPFFVADPGCTFILLAADRAMLRIAHALAKADAIEVLEDWISRAEAGAHHLWDPSQETFTALNLRSSRHSVGVSNAALLCFFADVGSTDQKRAMLGHYRRLRAKTRFSVPSHDPDEAHFDSKRYWRGPVWSFMNMMISRGLLAHGHVRDAKELWDDTRALTHLSGFAEYFDCNSGTPAGGDVFSWTAAAWLHYAAEGAPWAPGTEPHGQ